MQKSRQKNRSAAVVRACVRVRAVRSGANPAYGQLLDKLKNTHLGSCLLPPIPTQSGEWCAPGSPPGHQLHLPGGKSGQWRG